ncbi:MAG: glycosyltransferase family 4 protein [Actinomycetales bacterium]|nr:glycosyltransferase family 4 protein [Actinomycetales bacterium]
MREQAATSGGALRIQIVSTYYAPETTGNAPYVTSLSRGLAALGHDVSVIAGAPHYPGWRILPDEEWSLDEVTEGVHVRRVTSYVPTTPTFPKRVLYELGFGIRLAAYCKSDVDAVLLVSPTLFGSWVVRTRLAFGHLGVPIVLWVQDLYSAGVSESPGLASRALCATMAALEGALLRSARSVVVIHDRFREYATGRLRVPASSVVVIRNWTHVTSAGPVDRLSVRERLGWTRPGEVVVLHAGNMGAKQGLENVVDAALFAEQHQLPLRFVLRGDGNQRAALEKRAKGCSTIEFVAPLPGHSFMDALAAADVLLVNERPSLRDAALPSKLTSYFVTGRPVLAATDSGSTTADEIRASRAGRVVSPIEPEALARAALSIAREWTADDAKAGPAHVERALSQTAGVAQFESLLRDAATKERDFAGRERVR